MPELPKIFNKNKKEELNKKEKEIEIHKDRSFLKIASKKLKKIGPILAASFYLFFPAFNGPARADAFKEATKVMEKVTTGMVLLDAFSTILNKDKIDKENAYEAYLKTKELNDVYAIKEFLKPGKRFTFDNVQINSRGFFIGRRLDIKSASKQLVGTLLSSLGLQEVGQIRDIREISRERQELRTNPEVAQHLIPRSGTLEPSQLKVDISTSIIFNAKRQDRNFDIRYRGGGNLGIFDKFKNVDVITVINIDILDQDTSKKISMIGIGTSYRIEQMSDQIRRVSSKIRYSNLTMESNDLSILESLASATDNLLLTICQPSRVEKDKVSRPTMIDIEGSSEKIEQNIK